MEEWQEKEHCSKKPWYVKWVGGWSKMQTGTCDERFNKKWKTSENMNYVNRVWSSKIFKLWIYLRKNFQRSNWVITLCKYCPTHKLLAKTNNESYLHNLWQNEKTSLKEIRVITLTLTAILKFTGKDPVWKLSVRLYVLGFSKLHHDGWNWMTADIQTVCP